MSLVTTHEKEVLNERPPTKRVTFDLENIQIETISDYSSISSSSNESLLENIPKREERKETLIKPSYWYPPVVPTIQPPKRSTEYTEQLISKVLQREMALDPILFHNEQHKILFVKLLKAETLDFPIEKGECYVHCSIRYKELKSSSHKQILSHTINIEQHELRIDQVDPTENITVTLYVNQKKPFWYKRIRPKKGLDRYIHPQEGSLCQTTFSANRFMNNHNKVTTATLLLVNDWYRSNHPTVKYPMEKAVGKLYIQCLYSLNKNHKTMDEAIVL
ncbi:hypothetical protein G6F37_004264 [Rhizopus arrhizus]|nr:hypothetical protein G6F38_006746 [Rhizopus arrhizus]KAG1160137.1 hypothetical protein G6F37_004264 [Rhizopus arrhizus]